MHLPKPGWRASGGHPMQHVKGRRVCQKHMRSSAAQWQKLRGRVEALHKIHEGRMVSPVDEEADFGEESRFSPHAVRLQFARVVIEEVTGELPSIHSTVEYGEGVAGRLAPEHRVKP
jgi:hypothetical protein